MYGAILVQETELTERGEADIGVLFCHNGKCTSLNKWTFERGLIQQLEGYSTMCGHATMALGRFLVDTHDLKVFPRREHVLYDQVTSITELRLHAPCGVVRVKVPTRQGKSDPNHPVGFFSVPSFVTGTEVKVAIPKEIQWGGVSQVQVDVAYGGAFYAIVTAKALGFEKGLRDGYRLRELSEATATLKSCMASRQELFAHPREPDLEFLYGVMVIDDEDDSGMGICFFADQQIDRSPTGSCVSAQIALQVQKGRLQEGEEKKYHSIVSLEHNTGGFTGKAVGKTEEGVIVLVEGYSFYTGVNYLVWEVEDSMGLGLVLPTSL